MWGHHFPPTFTCILEIKPRSLGFLNKSLYPLSNLTSPCNAPFLKFTSKCILQCACWTLQNESYNVQLVTLSDKEILHICIINCIILFHFFIVSFHFFKDSVTWLSNQPPLNTQIGVCNNFPHLDLICIFRTVFIQSVCAGVLLCLITD